MDLQDCLPAALRGAKITRVAAGLSGAGVYRVQAGEAAFVLKLTTDAEPLGRWRGRLYLNGLAADAGLAPGVVHFDEARRAVVSLFVADRGFLDRLGDPETRGPTIDELGRTLARVHALPLPARAQAPDPRALLQLLDAALVGATLPGYVREAIAAMLTEEPPPSGRPDVVSHNDVNPTNLAHDGERLLLIDWDNAGPNDPFYDLAAAALFLRLDTASCLRLLAAHDGAPATELPARFTYDRRLIAVLCGVAFLHLTHQRGHVGEDATLDSAPTLEELYARMRRGELNVGSAEGQWWFGLALVKAGRST